MKRLRVVSYVGTVACPAHPKLREPTLQVAIASWCISGRPFKHHSQSPRNPSFAGGSGAPSIKKCAFLYNGPKQEGLPDGNVHNSIHGSLSSMKLNFEQSGGGYCFESSTTYVMLPVEVICTKSDIQRFQKKSSCKTL
eukprot:418737-Amphidinium_carterae.1